MPKIREMLLILEGFKYATSIDLKAGCYYIQLSEDTSNLCTNIIPRGKHRYKYLPMGFANSPDIYSIK